jgi:factor associated with neutral sphingomyelinase activation
MLRLHAGKFDSPDRLFDSIMNEWNSVTENPADVKELIPEWYGDDPSFLINAMKLDLGVKQNGLRVGDVRLPPWASDAAHFLSIQR